MSSSPSEAVRPGPMARPSGAPRFYYPLPMPEISHIPTDVATQVAAWKESYGFREKSPTSHIPGTILTWSLGRFSTKETNKAVLYGIGCLMEWALALDDDVLDHAQARSRPSELIRLVCEMTRVLESPGYHPPEDQNFFIAAGHDAMEQLRAECTPTQMDRLSAGLRRLFMSAVHKLHVDEPSEDEYLSLRFQDFGSSVYAVLIDMCGPAPTPDEEWNSPAVQAAVECVTLLCALENDVFSFHKEKSEGQPAPNFLDVLQTNRGLSFDEAVAMTVETRDRLMLLFLRLRERLMASAGAPLRNLIERLGHFVITNTEVTLCAPRYNPPPAQPLALEEVIKTPACWAQSPSTTNTSPLPYPSISWWWDHC
ncbi:terpene synthase family protein [Streptomyces sp. AK02-01A]|uniref:terpene synthase family protein n=1 Tax=Streptomyces sp. AK02-01A TaxID=3028648 RepID=UPI0029BACEF5|nr:terpene synthase family protein [Streptomyces sp. AK02-01A]MDX3853422.1 terpene synthase family protein [Streptomyces sp. AK02-01A]